MANIHTSRKLHSSYQTRMERVRLGVHQSSGRSALPDWMMSNLRDPHDITIPWSFKHHEYQPGILVCDAAHTAVKKSSQVGVSEMSAREVLGMMTLLKGSQWIYSLQTTTFARKFATSRLNPIIEASESLSRARHSEADSTELKRIGHSFLHLVGAQKTGQAISVPCRGVIRDEIDFCNQAALTSLLSRLTHNDPGTQILRDFSTPTIPEYGIDKLYNKGTQNAYMIWHEVCGQWVVLDPVFDIVVPGFDRALLTLTKTDLQSRKVRVEKSWVKCRHCQKEITRANLMNPRFRSWVPKYTDRKVASFYVSPLDVPKYNTPEKIVSGIEEYDRVDDWINFGLGHAHLAAGTAILPAAITESMRGEALPPGTGVKYGSAIGLDVGKTCHEVVLSLSEGKYVVHWMEMIRQKIRMDGTDEVSGTVLKRQDQYGVTQTVVDGGPDVTIPAKVIEGSGYGRAWSAYFARSIKGLRNYSKDEVRVIVTIDRTGMLDSMVRDINSGMFVFPKNHSDTEILSKHLQKLRRVRRVSETTGEEMVAWISLDDDDHYAFALLYAYVAMKLQEAEMGANVGVAPGTLVSKVRLPMQGEAA